ncbi:methyl-accepting chemotaxis protein [Alicyclobacillus macrosporangiidus]|uniref:Methyl-accepting chemotaxis protein n=1 Tax=Alicyclobacillus macrosporangiidus TaxID=392015 RepID=A0A1I7LB71_9BACL|nr:methyl-accepting chemotaxis protein [Alicyclobacillus macrosporangiidus]SFV06941.1 methyl-accepting chemotaxis protein [Alicyclobacillus macrosporangiidus]
MTETRLQVREDSQNGVVRWFQDISVQHKLMIPLTWIVLVSLLVVGVLGVNTAHRVIVSFSQSKLTTDSRVSFTLLDNQFNGNWQVVDGKLWKGAILFNDNAAVMNEMNAELGDQVALYLGDVRVATSLKDASGQSAVGVKAPPAVADAVLKQGKVYTGQETLGGEPYETAYLPIRDGQMRIVGMWFIGIPLREFVAAENTLRVETALVGLSVLLLMFALGWLLARRFKRALGSLVSLAKDVGGGNLTRLAEVDSGDEVGQLAEGFNDMILALRSLISEAGRASALVAAAAGDLSAIAEEGSRGAEEVSSTIEEVAAGAKQQVKAVENGTGRVAEISHRMQHIAESARTVAAVAEQAHEVTEEGNLSIRQAVSQMHSIQQSVGELEKFVLVLREDSKRIGDIVEAMDAIASQTKLLALNAAIEAARAGEQGLGFTVVAAEVRKLAEQSSASAKRVADLVVSIQTGIKQVLQYTQHCQAEVAAGMNTVNTTGQSFEQIREAVSTVSSQMQDVTSAVEKSRIRRNS